jgi:hypothetical protein
VREAAAAALEQRTAFDEARDAVALEPAARRALPGVAQERVAAFALSSDGADGLLQAEQVVANGGRGWDSPVSVPAARCHAGTCAPENEIARNAS